MTSAEKRTTPSTKLMGKKPSAAVIQNDESDSQEEEKAPVRAIIQKASKTKKPIVPSSPSNGSSSDSSQSQDDDLHNEDESDPDCLDQVPDKRLKEIFDRERPHFTEHEEKDQDVPGLFDIPDADVEMASEHSRPSSRMDHSRASSCSEHFRSFSRCVTLPPLTDSDWGFQSSAPNSDDLHLSPRRS